MACLVLPAGLTRGGLPVGLGFDMLPGQDEELLSLGLTLEKSWACFAACVHTRLVSGCNERNVRALPGGGKLLHTLARLLVLTLRERGRKPEQRPAIAGIFFRSSR